MDRLFGKTDIFAVLEGQKAALSKGIDDLKPDSLLKVSEADCVQYLVERYRLEVPVLREEHIHVDGQRETRVDVTGRWEYGAFDGERVEIPGTATTIVIRSTEMPTSSMSDHRPIRTGRPKQKSARTSCASTLFEPTVARL